MYEPDPGEGTATIGATWIPTADGTRLSGRIWLPPDARDKPVPAILEYLPYRKGDFFAGRDAMIGSYHAAHGYAYVRVDIRGTGDSDGIITDEYTREEQDDGVAVIAWIAAQPWCDGAVGMMGLSWGGFNSLQLAARRPPELRAVVSIGSTDDRYADDVHYYGGCVLAAEMQPWATFMLPIDLLPPDPAVVGDAWRNSWLDRLERTPPMIDAWLGHQRRDDYWKHGSVCEDYASIEVPVYMVGGWADAYTNAIPRTLAGLPGVRKGLIGPWPHEWPHKSTPGPAIGFLQETLRWWDRWLKGVPNGIDEEPMLLAWIGEAVAPSRQHEDRPGRWVAASSWPPAQVQAARRFLCNRGLAEESSSPERLAHRGVQHHGSSAGMWCPYGTTIDFPTDQRQEDALCLTFDSAPLAAPVDLLGRPVLRLRVSSDRRLALVMVRLCDVSPDGTSFLISRGALNLTHRNSHEEPTPLVPGTAYDVDIQLDALGHRASAGHRFRLAVSSTYWPWLWPSPEEAILTVDVGDASWLDLPVRDPAAEDAEPAFGPPEAGPGLQMHTEQGPLFREVTHEHGSGTYTTHLTQVGDSLTRYGDGLTIAFTDCLERFTIREGVPLSASVESERRLTLSRGAWEVSVHTVSSMAADTQDFLLVDTVEAFEGPTRVAAKSWTRKIARDLV